MTVESSSLSTTQYNCVSYGFWPGLLYLPDGPIDLDAEDDGGGDEEY
jgi:hypothetical protein